MGTCIICTKNFENGRTECPECGFSTKLPKFLSAEQYTEWSNETVVPYRKDYLMKKKVREIERFKKAEQLSREVSQEIAAEKVKNIVEDTVNATVSKQLLVLQKESLKGLKERVQKLLQDFEAKQDWKADVPKEYVFFYTEGMPLSKEEVSLKTDRAKTAEQWETLKQRIQSQAEKTDISLKPEKQQEIEGNVSKTFEESLSSNVAARNLLEIKKIAEEVLEKNGDKEEIRQKALEVFKMISESDLADFKEKITISLDKLLKESMDQEEEALFKEMEADAKKNVEKLSAKESVASGVKGAAAFGLDFYVILHGNQTTKLEVHGNQMTLEQKLNKWNDIVSIAAGDDHVVGLISSGEVLAEGNDRMDQCKTKNWKDIIMITACGSNTAALDRSGKVYVCGEDASDMQSVKNWSNISKIALGTHHILGLKKDGTVVAAGSNMDEQCEVAQWKNIVEIAAGAYHSLGVTSSGTVKAAGSNFYGECDVENWGNICAVKAGEGVSAGLQKDGTVIFAGEQIAANALREAGKIDSFEMSQSGELRGYYQLK